MEAVAVASPSDDCDAMRTLLHLPEDALVAVLTCALDSEPTGLAASLQATARALVCTCHFFASGLGALALERAGLAAVGRLLGVAPVRVPQVTGCASPLDAILFALRLHETAAPVACGGCHTLLLVQLPGQATEAAPAAGAAHAAGAVPVPGVGAPRPAPVASVSLLSCGSNEAGQLGNGSRAIFNAAVTMPTVPYDAIEYTARRSRQLERSDPSVPSAVDGLSGAQVAAVSAGLAHSLALTHSGQVFAWGDTGSGQCGAPAPQVMILTPRRFSFFDGRVVVQVAAGQLHSAFLLRSGQVYCCGENSSGQLGVVDNTAVGVMARSTPRAVALPERALSIAAGGFHTLVIGGGARRYVWGWGSGLAGQLGVQGVCRLSAPPPAIPVLPATNAGPAVPVLPMAGGGGGGGQGLDAPEAAMPHFEYAAVPTLVHGGLLHTGGLHPGGEGGAAGAFGGGWTGQAGGVGGGAAAQGVSGVETEWAGVGGLMDWSGCPGAAHLPPPTTRGGALALLPPIAQLAAGMYHSLFLTLNGEVLRCGGELGPYHPTTVYAPQPIPALRGHRVVRVAAGARHSCFVTAGGELWTCGEFKYGRLGLPVGLPLTVPYHTATTAASDPTAGLAMTAMAATSAATATATATPAPQAIQAGAPVHPGAAVGAEPAASGAAPVAAPVGHASSGAGHALSSAAEAPTPFAPSPAGAAPTVAGGAIATVAAAIAMPGGDSATAYRATAAAGAAGAPHPLLEPTDNVPHRVPLPPGLRVRWVGAGAEHTIVLFTDRSAPPLCFGRNVFGQLGTGSRRPRGYPAGVVAIPEGAADAIRDGLTSTITSLELGEMEATSVLPGVAGGAAARIPEVGVAARDREKGVVVAPTPICRVLSRWG